MWSDFKAFIARGNVIQLAVGIIIGGAFATITKSLTDDVIMPVVGAIFGGFDFSNYFVMLKPVPAGYHGPMSYAALKAAGVPLLGYGQFVTVSINFVILAFIVFLIVRAVNRMERSIAGEKTAQPVAEPAEVTLLREIRDELKGGRA